MVKYGDYFSRKVLYNCGISPDKTMFSKERKNYVGEQRTEQLRSTMSDIYQTLSSGYSDKNANSTNDDISKLNFERKIVNAFYDSGILTNAERDYFQTQSLQLVERESICVEEANFSVQTAQSQRVEPQIQAPVMRNEL